MRQTISLVLTSALAALSLGLTSATAFAGDEVNPCNNIEIGAQANCEVEVSGGCVAKCEPISFEASCSAELKVQCDGQCNASADVKCSADCSANCNAQCMVDPGKFDCSAGCQADCSANCDARCAASANKSQCAASCRATCTGDCDAKCSATPPSADCKAKCDASCSGSCEAQANIDCQVSCQSMSFAKCETDLKGGCETQCMKPEGALFCDGQYVDPRDNLQSCLDYIEKSLQIDVKGYADGDAQCSGNTCTAEGEAGISCSAQPVGANSDPANLGAMALAAVGASVLVARRRRR